ncbi:MAG: thioredoxin family protein [Bacteroidia bacterium]|nr:thioredoxin family protein [Bacteroidia bacterium]MDW8015482.1 thioredoxin family protein [Bacteroidia bacterium]
MRIVGFAFLSLLFGQERGGIRFFEGTWEELLREAQKQKRLIFVDFYTTWCGPCKMLERYTFSNPEVGAYAGKHYIPYRIDAEKGEGLRLANRYRIRAYPTIVFLDPEGNEIGRHVGYVDAPTFLTILGRYQEKYAQNKGESKPSWDSFKEKYQTFFSLLTRQSWEEGFLDRLSVVEKEERVYSPSSGTLSDEVLYALSLWRRGQREAALHNLHHRLFQQEKLSPLQTLWLAAYAVLNWDTIPLEAVQWITYTTKRDPSGMAYLTQAALYYRLGRLSEAHQALKQAQRDLPTDTPALATLHTLVEEK